MGITIQRICYFIYPYDFSNATCVNFYCKIFNLHKYSLELVGEVYFREVILFFKSANARFILFKSWRHRNDKDNWVCLIPKRVKFNSVLWLITMSNFNEPRNRCTNTDNLEMWRHRMFFMLITNAPEGYQTYRHFKQL